MSVVSHDPIEKHSVVVAHTGNNICNDMIFLGFENDLLSFAKPLDIEADLWNIFSMSYDRFLEMIELGIPAVIATYTDTGEYRHYGYEVK